MYSTMERGGGLPNPLWMEKGREVRENYYDDRGNNYLQRLIVCICCKAFIRRIIRTAACTAIYLSFPNCHSNPLHVYNSPHHANSTYAWTYASIIRHNTFTSTATATLSDSHSWCTKHIRTHSQLWSIWNVSVLSSCFCFLSPNTFAEIFRSVEFQQQTTGYIKNPKLKP
jgi:hypothetical protein